MYAIYGEEANKNFTNILHILFITATFSWKYMKLSGQL